MGYFKDKCLNSRYYTVPAVLLEAGANIICLFKKTSDFESEALELVLNICL